jgi:hypothetical protein
MKRRLKVVSKVKKALTNEDAKDGNIVHTASLDSIGTQRVSVIFDWINGRMTVVR